MTIGFLLVFLGIKFHLVESYLLTPNATKFWNSRISSGGGSATPIQDGFNNSVNQMANNTRNGFNAIGGFDGGNLNNGSYSPYSGSPYNPYSQGYMNNQRYGNPNNSLFQNASYNNRNGYGVQTNLAGFNAPILGPQKQLSTPKWLGWPALFLGAVLILQGLIMRKD